MPKTSAGILLYRLKYKLPEVLLVHPGGPFWAKKDQGAWSVPKGEFDANEEDAWEAAKRELEEETGIVLETTGVPLTPVKQGTGKIVYAWAVKMDVDLQDFKSNLFEMEWPPKSGQMKTFPEVDKAAWLNMEEARQKILAAQLPFLQQLEDILTR